MHSASKTGISGALFGAVLGFATSCVVADKGDYTFEDEPGQGGRSNSGGSSGKGSGGSNGGSSGSNASGGDSGSGAAGSGGTGGSAGRGSAGTSGRGGSAGDAGGGGDDPCDPNPCENGDCSVDGEDYDCDCYDGYEGSRCQTDTDDCEDEPCQNGGLCSDLVDDYECDCSMTSGYTGKDCQIAPGAGCEEYPCHNGGTCNPVSGGGYRCDCAGTGYEGDTCETDIDECARRLDNCDPLADCGDFDGGFTCVCREYYQDVNRDGTLCQAYPSCAALLQAYPNEPNGRYPIAYAFATSSTDAYCDMGNGGWTNLDFANNVIYLENGNYIYCDYGLTATTISITCSLPYANALGDGFLYQNSCAGDDGSANYIYDEIGPLLGHPYYAGLGGFATLQQEYLSGSPLSASPYYYEYCYVDGSWYANYEEPCWAYGGNSPNGPCIPSYFTLSY